MKLQKKDFKRIALRAAGALAVVAMPTIVAAASGGVSEMDAAIDYVISLITGKYVTGIAIVAATVGVIAFMSGQEMGKLMEVLMRVAIGIGVVVGIVNVIDRMRGNGAILQAAAAHLGLA